VLKFGGTSLQSREHWETLSSIVTSRLTAGYRVFVVCSALATISKALETLIDAAGSGRHEPVLEEIRRQHLALADRINVDGPKLLAEHFQVLERLAYGISLTEHVDPRLRARVLAVGEIMITVLGSVFLASRGIDAQWMDARRVLKSREDRSLLPHERYLSARCLSDPDPELQAISNRVIITQGFIASNALGHTVLVGWEGSDTSAACFAAKLEASRLEIWTDVPGIFTADPSLIPDARLLKQLEYDEAQELASAGAVVLHPRCIDPLRDHCIPLLVRSTANPELEGTAVVNATSESGPQVKAIATRLGLTLIIMETPRMWHSVGFLARIFNSFAQHKFSVGLVATSETCVSVSIDPVHGFPVDAAALEALLVDLESVCTARSIQDCAAISLVGRDIRSVLHELGPAMEVLDEQKLYLVSQAARDVNFTFVVDGKHADRVTQKLHGILFGQRAQDGQFGPSYRELFEEATPESRAPWWHGCRAALLRIAHRSGPCFVYDAQTIIDRAGHLKSLQAVSRCFYSVKACSHPEVVSLLYNAGLGLECVSPGELNFAHDLIEDLDPDRVLFTPNFVTGDEYETGFRLAGHVTLDSLRALELWPDVFAGREVLLRIDPGQGYGHHKHVRTAGKQSKFGVSASGLARLAELAGNMDLRVTGLHAHVGSGILTPETWGETAIALASAARFFPDAHHLNLGGGLGVPERPGISPLDLDRMSEYLDAFQKAHPQFEVWLEPGRYLVAESGVLLARVTQIKRKGEMRYVGLETGINSLIRPALYGSYHRIYNLTRLDETPDMTAEIVGPICETGDILGHARRLPHSTTEQDVLLIATAGAYGRVMSSNYNMRSPAAEILLSLSEPPQD